MGRRLGDPGGRAAEIDVLFRKLRHEAVIPACSENVCGAELRACLRAEDYVSPDSGRSYHALRIRPGERRMVGTGLAIDLPCGFEFQLWSHRMLLEKHGVAVLHTPGMIAPGEEIRVILHNTAQTIFYVEHGAPIAQLVIVPVIRAFFREADRSRTAAFDFARS